MWRPIRWCLFILSVLLLSSFNSTLAEPFVEPEHVLVDHVGIACMMFAEGFWIRKSGTTIEQLTFNPYLNGHLIGFATTFQDGREVAFRIYEFHEHRHGSVLNVMSLNADGSKNDEQEYRAIAPAANAPELKRKGFVGASNKQIYFALNGTETFSIRDEVGRETTYRRVRPESDLTKRYLENGYR